MLLELAAPHLTAAVLSRCSAALEQMDLAALPAVIEVVRVLAQGRGRGAQTGAAVDPISPHNSMSKVGVIGCIVLCLASMAEVIPPPDGLLCNFLKMR